jgi:methionine-rich copper-binding protein CopC
MARLPVLLAFLAAFLLAAPAAARAHAILVEGQPAINASVPAGDVTVAFRFNSRIDGERSRLTITDEDHAQAVLPIAPETSDGPGGVGAVLHATAHLAPGNYTIRWQVLAVDGHITRGDVPFTVTAP